MAAGDVMRRVMATNGAGMSNSLPSATSGMGHDQCCGIHGAARERRGIKRGTSAARRRHDKRVVRDALDV